MLILISVAFDFIFKQKLSSSTKKQIVYGILLTIMLTIFTPIIHGILVSWGIIETANGSGILMILLCVLSTYCFYETFREDGKRPMR